MGGSGLNFLLLWGGGSVIALLTLFLISQSFATPLGRYRAYRNAILTLRELEATFSQDVLRSRYELFAYYDPIVRNLAHQERIHEYLSHLPDFVDGKERREFQRLLKERQTALIQKEELSEWFKSRNALLKNSLRYLPLLTSQVEESFNQESGLTEEQTASLQGTLSPLIRNLLLYNASGEESVAQQTEAWAQQLTTLENTLEIPEATVPTKVFRSHTHIILSTKPLVEELTEQLILPLGDYTDNLEITLERAYQQAGQRASLFRWLTLGWLLALVGMANYWFVRRLWGRDPAFEDYQRQVAELAKTAEQLQTEPSSGRAMKSLEPLLTRKDNLGQLALHLKGLGQMLQSSKSDLSIESFTFLVADLNLLTKGQRPLLNTEAATAVGSVLETTLADHHCELLDIQFGAAQVQVRFRYPLELALSELIPKLKAVAAQALYPIARGLDETLGDDSEIWSDTCLITSSDPPQKIAGQISLTEAEIVL